MRWETHRREIKRRLAQETIITFPRHFCCLLSTTPRATIPIVIISVPSFSPSSALIILYYRLSFSLAPRYTRSVGSELFYAIVKCYILILYTCIFLSPLRVQINGRRSFPITFWPRNPQLYIYIYIFYLIFFLLRRRRRRIMISDRPVLYVPAVHYLTHTHSRVHSVEYKRINTRQTLPLRSRALIGCRQCSAGWRSRHLSLSLCICIHSTWAVVGSTVDHR